MLTSYADTTRAGSSCGCRITEPVLEPANMKFAVSDNLDTVLVLSYTEFVQQPAQDGGGGSRTGAQGKATSPANRGLGGHGI